MGIFDIFKPKQPTTKEITNKVVIQVSETSTLSYFGYLEKITQSKDIEETIKYCEECLLVFPQFIDSCKKEKLIPPSVPCRDELIHLYKILGRWDDLDRILLFFRDNDGFMYMKPDSRSKYGERLAFSDGAEIFKQCETTKLVAQDVLNYINLNQGVLQSKIYKVPELSHLPKEEFKWFCRHSLQIRKEKEGKTNKLYIL